MRTRATAAAAAAAAFAASVACGGAAAAPRHATGYCAVANALAASDPAAARAALVRAALINPVAPCIKQVQAKLDPPPKPWKAAIEDRVADWTKLLGSLAGAAIAAVLVLGIAFGLLTRLKRVRRLVRATPLVRRLMQPRISLGTFQNGGGADDPASTGIEALVDNGLQRLAARSSGESTIRLGRSSGTDSVSDTIARLGDVSARFNALAAVVAFVARISALPIYTVNGTLQADGGAGLGLTLTLDCGRRAADATTLVRKKGNDSVNATFQLLALVAAGWIDYAVRKDAGLDFDFVASPRSIAFFRAGVVLQSLEHPEQARRAYREALRLDATNVGALVNLGRMYEAEGHWKRAEVLLRAAVDAFPTKPGADPRAPGVERNPLWYQAMYSLCAHYANAAVREPDEAEALRLARTYSATVARSAAETLLQLGYRSGRRLELLPRRVTVSRQRALARFLYRTVEPGALAILATFAPEPADLGRPCATVTRMELVELLEAAGADDEAAAAAVAPLLPGYVLARDGLSPRARFNVACHFAVAGSNSPARAEEALVQLREAMDDAPAEPPQEERRLLARAVWIDGWLEPLWDTHGPELEQLTAPYVAASEMRRLLRRSRDEAFLKL